MKKVLLKDLLFNESKIIKIATEISSINPVFKKGLLRALNNK